MCHAACINFTGLVIVRLLLGMCESTIIAGFMIVSSMFYTRSELTVRVGYWCEYIQFFYVRSFQVLIPDDLDMMNGTGTDHCAIRFV